MVSLDELRFLELNYKQIHPVDLNCFFQRPFSFVFLLYLSWKLIQTKWSVILWTDIVNHRNTNLIVTFLGNMSMRHSFQNFFFKIIFKKIRIRRLNSSSTDKFFGNFMKICLELMRSLVANWLHEIFFLCTNSFLLPIKILFQVKNVFYSLKKIKIIEINDRYRFRNVFFSFRFSRWNQCWSCCHRDWNRILILFFLLMVFQVRFRL